MNKTLSVPSAYAEVLAEYPEGDAFRKEAARLINLWSSIDRTGGLDGKVLSELHGQHNDRVGVLIDAGAIGTWFVFQSLAEPNKRVRFYFDHHASTWNVERNDGTGSVKFVEFADAYKFAYKQTAGFKKATEKEILDFVRVWSDGKKDFYLDTLLPLAHEMSYGVSLEWLSEQNRATYE